ncbi:hypothetical protein K3M67_13900 [Sphingobium sp. V4]|uniref:hypothetical protein n=1 Tax=Sphingobium sp. V4 TaxID=3038927 RepID=UPI002557F007|nr:hypothetical protein [Sphingobium sp. V4]WIW88036.1 hypothetical protein K3M67_13900 [Sphingobium sp. V4]
MARIFTRREFYDLVWSKPITHIAKDFSLSDVAIHKICRKHAIPTPPAGYWARKNAGKDAEQASFPKEAPRGLAQVTIAAPEMRGETAAVAAAREEARVRASDEPADARPDPIVERSLAALRAASVSFKGIVSVEGPDIIQCEISPASIERLEEILKRIVAAAKRQGFALVAGNRRACFRGSEETIGLSIVETVRRVKHELTVAEQAEEAAWKRKAERKQRGNPWDWEYPPRPVVAEWDYICTGQLGIEMEGVYVASGQGPRKTFRDAKVQKLENLSSDIAVALAVLAVAKREERERRAEEERVRLEAQRERERPFREEHVEDRRRACLDELLEDMSRLERLRSLERSLLHAPDKGDDGRVFTFARWLGFELARREAMFSVAGLEQRFQAERVFGDDDDHAFQSKAWY